MTPPLLEQGPHILGGHAEGAAVTLPESWF